MNRTLQSLIPISGILVLMWSLFSAVAATPVTAQTSCAYLLKNATEYTTPRPGERDTYAVRGDINYTFPNVPNAGGGSYHRVSAYDSGDTPGEEFRYYEFGWIRYWEEGSGWTAPRQGYYLGWNEPGNLRRGTFIEDNSVMTGYHKYGVDYNSNNGKWRSKFDGTLIPALNRSMDWGPARNAFAGGETGCGDETFNCVITDNLATRGKFGGTTLFWQNWGFRNSYVDNYPYNNQNFLSNSVYRFYSHHNYSTCPGAFPPSLNLSEAVTQTQLGYGE